MNKKAIIKTAALITAVILIFSACSGRKESGAAIFASFTEDLSILGEWSYIGSRSGASEDLFIEEGFALPAASVLSIIKNPNYEEIFSTEILSYDGIYIYYGALVKEDSANYNFRAGYKLEITTGITTDLLEVFNLTYDPAAERLCWVGEETGLLRYYERK